MGIGKGSEDIDTFAKFLLIKQLQTILNSHQIANINLAGIALDSRNLKAFECNYENLTKLKLLLDIKYQWISMV